MTKTSEEINLKDWLNEKPAEFACALAARIALRTVPLLEDVLYTDEALRRDRIILPAFRVLTALNFAAVLPSQSVDLPKETKESIQLARNTMDQVYNEAWCNLVESIEAVPEKTFYIGELESQKNAAGTASKAVDAIEHATRAAIEMIDFCAGLASFDAIADSAVSTAKAAHSAVDQANGNEGWLNVELSDDDEEIPPPLHIIEFWKAIDRDVASLNAHMHASENLATMLQSLSALPLWANGIPIWASRRWASFKDKLQPYDRCKEWTQFYEDRLKGRNPDHEKQMLRMTISKTAGKSELESEQATDANTDLPYKTDDDVEGLDNTTGNWGEYPLDDLLIRQENRTIHDVIRRIDKLTYVMNPDFQRDFIWNEDKQSKLIESVIMRIPLPVFYMAEDDQGRMVVVDGLQRLSTFKRFIKDELRLKLSARPELNGTKFSQLPSKIQNRVEDCNLIFYIIDSKVPERARLDIFERVNGGVPLTRQQMRNCLFMGQATKFLKDESQSDIFLEVTDRSLNQNTMRDREFVNRFCAFHLLCIAKYRGDMDDFLAQCLRHMNTLNPTELSSLSTEFRRGLLNNLLLFNKHAFRKYQPNQSRRSVLNASLWDVLSTELTRYEEEHVSKLAEPLRKSFYNLLDNEEFNSAITGGTNDAKKVKIRFDMAQKCFRGILDDFQD
ncbi:MAG: DUF262 domain-containing protein [Aestuariivita sp.]|nr:DUF262 domain-containing protein [Aestuariivita sp.]